MPGDETGSITKDPSKPRFWTPRNIGGLVMLAALSAGTPKIVESIQNYHALHDRAEDLEKWRKELEQDVNDKAYWDAFADVNNKIAELDKAIGVLTKLFDREFGRGAGELAARMEQDLLDLQEERAQIAALHEQLETLIEHYHRDHPEVTPKIKPLPPGTAEQEAVTQEDVRRLIEQSKNGAPNTAQQYSGTRLKEFYGKRNPKK